MVAGVRVPSVLVVSLAAGRQVNVFAEQKRQALTGH